jgi:hypothetical protein
MSDNWLPENHWLQRVPPLLRPLALLSAVVLGLTWVLLLTALAFALIPILLLAFAVLTVQSHIERWRLVRRLRQSSRVISWETVANQLKSGRGTLIVVPDLRVGVTSLWWVDGPLDLQADVALPTWWDHSMRVDWENSFNLYQEERRAMDECYRRYLDPESGTAQWVAGWRFGWRAAVESALEETVVVCYG